MYVDLVLNLTLLVALSGFSGFLVQHRPGRARLNALLQGSLFGGAAVLGMLHPYVLGNGVILDGRSVMLSLGAYFFGPWAALPAVATTVICRLQIGGAGALTGVLVILSSAAIGLGARRLRPPESDRVGAVWFLGLGVVVHAVMLALFLTLPDQLGWPTLLRAASPVFLVYPLATILAGRILADQLATRQFLVSLEDARQALDVTLRSLGEAVIAVDLRGEVMRMNPVAEQLTGWLASEAQSRPLTDVCRLLDETTREQVPEGVESVVATGQTGTQHSHYILVARDGSERNVSQRVTPLLDDRNITRGRVLVLSDQTEERRAETTLRQSEERLRLALASSHQGLFDLDIRTGGAVISPEHAITLGYDPETFDSGQEAWLSRVHPEDRESVGLAYGDCVRGTTKEYRVEFRERTRSGDWKWILSQGRVWEWTPEGVPVRMLGTLTDITERRSAEEQLRLRSAALESSVNSVVITDPSGTIEWVNPAFCRISGYQASEVIGRNPRVLKSDQQSPEVYTEMWRTITAGNPWRGGFVNRRKDGSLYTEDVTITPVSNPSGRVSHYVAIKQDISSLKQSVAELQTAHALLAERNRALDEALAAARAAAEAKATFLATMSHELRTPMNGVLGMASLLCETAPLTGEQLDYVRTIHASGETLLTLINDVLDFSKIESDHLKLAPVNLDLRHCVEETLELLAPLAREKQLDLVAEIGPHVPAVVRADGMRLRQVLTNLVGNAVKFTRSGEVVLGLDSDPGAGTVCTLRFSVRDTGIGIAPDRLEHVFEPFSQADSSTTRLHGGTGLGLAISQRLVGLMGSRIDVSAAPGVGSTFSFEIDVPPVQVPATAAPRPLPPNLARCTVLIVDDNPTNRRLLTHELQTAGCHPVAVESGPAGLDWLHGHPWPDLVITDMLMPEMDGLEFASELRALEGTRNPARPVPMLLLASGGYQASDPRNERAGISAVLFKPVRQRQLFDTVTRALERREARPSRLAALTPEVPAPAGRPELRILLAEDNPVNRKVALAILRRLGYEADVAMNGAEAVEACRQKSYDLIFMDVQMPQVDGLEATRLVRQLPGDQPRIFAMTANAMAGDREICLAAGMDDYIAKPVRVEDLRRALAA